MLNTEKRKQQGKKQTKVFLSQRSHSLVKEINFKEANKYILKHIMSDREEHSEENQIRVDA